jgi:hypothetical protein
MRHAEARSRRPQGGRCGHRGGNAGGCRVFAFLEAHKAAWARFEEQDGSEHELFTEAAGAVDAALDAITSTPPTTVAGMRAVMEYFVELDGHEDYLPTLLRSSLLRSPVLAG